MNVSSKPSDESASSGRKRVGGRSARVRNEVLQATWDILLEQGVDGLNFSEIGRRAGVHGTSVQRRWGSRENVVFEAMLNHGTQFIAIPDTGSLRDDLLAFSRTFAAYLSTPMGGAIQQMLVTDATNDPAFAGHRAEFVRIRYQAMQLMIQRAAARGELRPGIDEETALDLALGPLYVRTLITRRPIDDAFIARCVDTLLEGLAPTGMEG